MRVKIKVNDYALLQKVKDGGGYCLCSIDRVACMCDEFKAQKSGLCHCLVYSKELEGDDND